MRTDPRARPLARAPRPTGTTAWPGRRRPRPSAPPATHRRRHGRMLARAQRVHAHRRLDRLFWRPVDQHLAARGCALVMLRDDQVGFLTLAQLGHRLGERAGLLVGRRPGSFSGMYSCSPFEPLVLAKLSQAAAARTCHAAAAPTRQHSTIEVSGAGIEVEHDVLSAARGARREPRLRVQLERGQVGEPHERRRCPSRRRSRPAGPRWRSSPSRPSPAGVRVRSSRRRTTSSTPLG